MQKYTVNTPDGKTFTGTFDEAMRAKGLDPASVIRNAKRRAARVSAADRPKTFPQYDPANQSPADYCRVWRAQNFLTP